MEQLASVFIRRAHVDQTTLGILQSAEHIITECTEGLIGGLCMIRRRLEFLLIDEVTVDLVLHINMPVEFYSARQVSNFIEQHIFVRLDQADIRVIKMLSDPVGLYQYFGVGIPRCRTHT